MELKNGSETRRDTVTGSIKYADRKRSAESSIMGKEHEVAGVTVLYNPDASVVDNIRTYINQVSRLYVVDNSDSGHANCSHNFTLMPGVEYINNNANLGIARALNIGAGKALEEGYRYLLTMDQDSKATPGMVECLMRCYNREDSDLIGIVSPFHLTVVDTPPPHGLPCREVLTTWTSGNILNLFVYNKIGPFWDDLFIDFVDHEFCLRLNSHGYKVIETDDAILIHTIGTDLKQHNVFGVPLISSNHSYTRRYYITRNRFVVTDKYRHLYPSFNATDKKRFIAEIVTVLLFEKDKTKKIAMILKGLHHYMISKLGSIEHQIGI